MKPERVVLAAALALFAAACEPPPPPPPPPVDVVLGPKVCFIGVEDAPAQIQLIARAADGTHFVDLHDGDDVPLILPAQGGKVVLVGVRAKNVSCNLQLHAGVFDDCQSPSRIIGSEGRPIVLEEGPDGFGVPAESESLQNYANIPMCPSFAASRDVDGQPYRLQLRVTEVKRAGEEEARIHVFGATVTPFCAEPENDAACRCECDQDFVTETPQPEQCPTINDNDEPARFCEAVGEGEGEGDADDAGARK